MQEREEKRRVAGVLRSVGPGEGLLPELHRIEMPRRVYVAHPLRGNVEENTRKVGEICLRLAQDETLLPMSPVHAFGFCDPAGDQTVPFRLCRDLLASCDELWLYGAWWHSEGCRFELDTAKSLGLPVRFAGEEGQ